ncbi:MAG: gephyrin-like molybdotransferase Glp [Gaiellales bacterium]
MSELITVVEAQRRIVERVRRLDAERVPIERAFGRVLAEPVSSRTDLPPFASSAMDGFAVRAADTSDAPVTLTVAGRAAAGSPSGVVLEAGQAVEISTGGVVPEGADAVVPVELTGDGSEGSVVIRAAATPGAHIRPRAGDVAAGSTLLAPGTLLSAPQVGALAAAGVTEVQCAKRPRVGILVTGSELRRPGDPLGPGEIYESNGLMLAGQLASAGAVPAQLGVVSDDADDHRNAMEKGLLGFDMLVTSGGASVGPHDLVRQVLAALRVEEVFWGVAMKPGKPVAFGVRRDHVAFSLPGNPVSALVCFEVLVRTAVNVMLGIPSPEPRYAHGTLGAPVRRSVDRETFVRARAEHGAEAVVLDPVTGQESHMIAAAAQADALVLVPRGEGELPAGSPVRFLSLS